MNLLLVSIFVDNFFFFFQFSVVVVLIFECIGGQACQPAAELALDDVNNKSDLLPGFKLTLYSNDSEVSAIFFLLLAHIVKLIYRFMRNNDIKTARNGCTRKTNIKK